VKIAKPFVDDLGRDADAAAFVQAITTLGRTLGLTVIAEGVERPDQVAELVAAGCEWGQGFLFARPAPIDAVAPERSSVAAQTAA
jgi:c-di-GMP phosphodiesterase